MKNKLFKGMGYFQPNGYFKNYRRTAFTHFVSGSILMYGDLEQVKRKLKLTTSGFNGKSAKF
jgi:hypothetical protein